MLGAVGDHLDRLGEVDQQVVQQQRHLCDVLGFDHDRVRGAVERGGRARALRLGVPPWRRRPGLDLQPIGACRVGLGIARDHHDALGVGAARVLPHPLQDLVLVPVMAELAVRVTGLGEGSCLLAAAREEERQVAEVVRLHRARVARPPDDARETMRAVVPGGDGGRYALSQPRHVHAVEVDGEALDGDAQPREHVAEPARPAVHGHVLPGLALGRHGRAQQDDLVLDVLVGPVGANVVGRLLALGWDREDQRVGRARGVVARKPVGVAQAGARKAALSEHLGLHLAAALAWIGASRSKHETQVGGMLQRIPAARLGELRQAGGERRPRALQLLARSTRLQVGPQGGGDRRQQVLRTLRLLDDGEMRGVDQGERDEREGNEGALHVELDSRGLAASMSSSPW